MTLVVLAGLLHPTSLRQGLVEDALDGLAGTAISPAYTALVLLHIRAQDTVTAHMLEEGAAGN